jgi:hypothetical protein
MRCATSAMTRLERRASRATCARFDLSRSPRAMTTIAVPSEEGNVAERPRSSAIWSTNACLPNSGRSISLDPAAPLKPTRCACTVRGRPAAMVTPTSEYFAEPHGQPVVGLKAHDILVLRTGGAALSLMPSCCEISCAVTGQSLAAGFAAADGEPGAGAGAADVDGDVAAGVVVALWDCVEVSSSLPPQPANSTTAASAAQVHERLNARSSNISATVKRPGCCRQCKSLPVRQLPVRQTLAVGRARGGRESRKYCEPAVHSSRERWVHGREDWCSRVATLELLLFPDHLQVRTRQSVQFQCSGDGTFCGRASLGLAPSVLDARKRIRVETVALGVCDALHAAAVSRILGVWGR